MKSTKLVLVFLLTSFYSFANVAVVNGLTHVFSGVSGDVISGEVILINYSSSQQRVIFELQEAIYSCTEERTFTTLGKHTFSSSSWVTNNVNEHILEPKEEYVLKFSIEIPPDTKLKGSFWSVLMVSVDSPIKEEVVHENIGIGSKIQYAVGLITNVNSLDEVNIDFKDVDSLEEDNRNLQVKIENKGVFAEATALSLEVYNENGDMVKEYKSKRLLVFPNLCRDYILNLSDLPKGIYDCVLLAESRETFIGTNMQLNID
ncbi:hypothetical protein LCGC14_0070420 [marine sediment metagenome]|uniref:Uncharacterized protein n=1 Tax=marine sediment metagenome TaxID=412755 RepID=A0A0F9VPP8_9ZZZZ|nr:hypothetical protein [Maribacter sp.]HDZ05396.1 hypothetical protein [Maribacter sp.]HEA81451.1 hypothetical protein [Maribacter sp.]